MCVYDLPVYDLGLGTGQFFFDTIFVSIQIDRYSINHLIHGLRTVIYEIFVV